MLSDILKEFLYSPLKNHVKVANIRDNCLVLEFSSAAWATKGRFIQQEIIEIAQSKFNNINKIDWYIRPE